MTMGAAKLEIPDALKPLVQAELKEGNYGDLAEFIREAVLALQEKRGLARAEARAKAFGLLQDAWLADESGLDEEVYPKLRAAMEETRQALYGDSSGK